MTIAAISTPAGVGGIAVVRVSGPQAFALVRPHVKAGALPEELGPAPHAAFTPFRVDGRLLDEVVLTAYRAPHSYTGEDVVELSCHGSLYVQRTLLQTLLDDGARLAEPGEFTRRAFLSGKFDLSQAEAVADLIDSTNAAAHQLAISQLRGGYAATLASLRQQLVDLASLLELELDFSDEEVEFADRAHLRQLLATLQAEVRRLIRSYALGNAIKQGLPVAIVGAPNAGKSTLLNALLGDDRAIVSDIPGTTRDTVEDHLVIDGYQFRFIDTAGLRSTADAIEQQGISRSYRAAEQARIILLLIPASEPDDEVQRQLADLRSHVDLADKRLILLRSKSDLSPAESADSFSARKPDDLDRLRQQLLAEVQTAADQPEPLLTNARHYEALSRVDTALTQVDAAMTQGLPADLVVVDLRDALYHLGTITGQVTSNEILGTIFGRFCIGK